MIRTRNLKPLRCLWSKALVACALLFAAGALQARGPMVSVARPEINMRSGPGTEHPALWTLAQGYPLEIVQTRGRWIKVRDFERDTGWVYRPLVSRAAHVIVKSRVANVRAAPRLGARVLGKAPYGEVMRRLEQRQGWIKVRRSGHADGWIAKQTLWGG